jgi:hypothetical protein
MESHLLGAYSYAVKEPIDFSQVGMLQLGAWNYLREEITVGLIQGRGVRMGQIFDSHIQGDPDHVLPPDRVSYLLARIINFCYPDLSQRMSLQERRVLWCALHADLIKWKANLPTSYEPFSLSARPGNPFTSLWMLQPWHGRYPCLRDISLINHGFQLTYTVPVAAQQYLAVAEILLAVYDPCPDGGHLGRRSLVFAEEKALQVCGLAWTNENDAARVNAFGPLAFCEFTRPIYLVVYA